MEALLRGAMEGVLGATAASSSSSSSYSREDLNEFSRWRLSVLIRYSWNALRAFRVRRAIVTDVVSC